MQASTPTLTSHGKNQPDGAFDARCAGLAPDVREAFSLLNG
jgi:hypothetical protein